MNGNLPIALLAIALVASAPVHAAGDAAAGKTKSAVCAACHGADGNSTNPEWPKLAGQNAGYLEKQLMDFKAGQTRSNALMTGMVANLSEQDMADLAAFYAAQNMSGGFVAEDQVALGRRIYQGGNSESGVPACMSCHGPAGKGDPAGRIPWLAGQFAVYVEAQLKAFKGGTRSNDRQAMMRETVRWISEPEMAAVAAYVNGLH